MGIVVMPPGNWITVSESKFSHELEALQFVRERLPAHEPRIVRGPTLSS